ncbi:hypothetical protein [Pseudomonas sp. IT-P100]|uniref:hypothetical protein n=1 Tax=Pseudomonas sp. IT-P100 TaxID=3026452 RepID=UPI0039E13611
MKSITKIGKILAVKIARCRLDKLRESVPEIQFTGTDGYPFVIVLDQHIPQPWHARFEAANALSTRLPQGSYASTWRLFCAVGFTTCGTSLHTGSVAHMIKFDSNTNDAESLLRHCLSVVPTGDDPRQVRRLQVALEAPVEHLRPVGQQNHSIS